MGSEGATERIPQTPTEVPPALAAHRGAVKDPDTLVQPEPSPPHCMHLSNFFLEPMMRSQPVGTQRPLTHTPVPSGEHGVPSTTCGTALAQRWHGVGTASAQRWHSIGTALARRQHSTVPTKGQRDTHPRLQHMVDPQAVRLAHQFTSVLFGDAAVPRHPIAHRRQSRRDDAVVVGSALLLPERCGGSGLLAIGRAP